MSNELMTLLLNSPVIVGVLTFLSGVISIVSKKPVSKKKIDEEDRKQKYDDDHKELMSISRNLDRHINNSGVPFRAQINEKIDNLTTMVEASLEAQKSANTSIKMIDGRVSTIEEKVDELERDRAREESSWQD